MSAPSPCPATLTLITAVADFAFDRVKLRCAAQTATDPATGQAYRDACQAAALKWRAWRIGLDDKAATALAELRAAAMVEPHGRPQVFADLLAAVDALNGVRVPPAFLHLDNDVLAADLTEQDEPGILQRLYLDGLRDFDACDRRLSAAVCEMQRLAALIPDSASRQSEKQIKNPGDPTPLGPFAPGCFRIACDPDRTLTAIPDRRWKLLRALWDFEARRPHIQREALAVHAAVYGSRAAYKRANLADLMRKTTEDSVAFAGCHLTVEFTSRGSDQVRLLIEDHRR